MPPKPKSPRAEKKHLHLLSFIQLANLSILTQMTPGQAQQRETRLNELLHICTDKELIVTDMNHDLKQFVFECMQLTTTPTNSDSTTQSLQINDNRIVLEKYLTKLDDDNARKESNSCSDDPYSDIIQ
ncbi:unnamed protein product [Didymodactylos carnosus]|uniref:Uncharacterized protein n=1 Tax=Didymodactylos carnosus TaxID=1234261 RepID=A0A814TIQ8_9BILA|nr:unnamed protein product [Didymodactylos carnosus]CAF3922119.1 unnamed protein product [Didymodactylos carnosus]